MQISELIQSFIYQNSDLSQYLKASEVTFKQGIESILRSDDRLLTSFQKLANDLNTNFSEDDRLIDRVKDLCARYIKYTVEGVRTRLDRIYLEALENSLDDEISPEDSQESKKVQEELESLYSEILPVAQISVEQQYLEPSLRLTSSNTSHCQERLTKAIEYVRDENIYPNLFDKNYRLRVDSRFLRAESKPISNVGRNSGVIKWLLKLF